ncbi:hypothetical protein PG993_003412 [Apiospora rasikravindrae]|uniref:Uncharacterized protein n=1 Tax=Apiospora rasikravindrae TaxID=990691 RepID=A0ABR1TZW8_9PEZI
MCTGNIYRMTRCKHCIVHYTSHCRRYQSINPSKTPSWGLLVPEPHDEPCPHLQNNSNDNKPVMVVPIDDSCASCMPRMQHWSVICRKDHLKDVVKLRIQGCLNKGDDFGAASERDRLIELEKGASGQIAAIDWSIIPALDPVYPPSWTVEDDRSLSAAWIGRQLVWADEETLRELRQQYKKEQEERRRRKEEEEEEEELEFDEDEDEVTVLQDDREPRNAGADEDDDYSYYSAQTRTSYYFSEDDFGDQGPRSGKDTQTTQSRRDYPRLRKRKGCEVLGNSEFFSSNLEANNDNHDAYHIDNEDDDDDDIWWKAATEPPRGDVKTTTTGSFPEHSRQHSQWTPDVARVNQNKRFSIQAVRGSKKKYDLKSYRPQN